MPSQTIIGVDLGGTKIDVGLFDSHSWNLLDHKRTSTEAGQTFEHVQEALIESIQLLKKDDTKAVGIGVPGLVSHPEGIILKMPNIPGGEGVNLRTEIEHALSLECFVDNDANCFTLAEAVMGEGKDQSIVVGITLGTGVGGGIVIEGKIFHGARGYAAEVGHMLLQPGQPPYTTHDKRGEVEQFFSGTAMGKRCHEASSPDEYLDGKVCSFMHKSIYQEVAWMCTNIIHLLDPSIIIFGGSAGNALKPHLSHIKEELERWIFPGTPLPHLQVSSVKQASMLGAALLTTQSPLHVS